MYKEIVKPFALLVCLLLLTSTCASASREPTEREQELLDRINLEIIRPSASDTEGRTVVFEVQSGLTRAEEKELSMKFYWVIEGENLNRPKKMTGNNRSQRFYNGDYKITLTETNRFDSTTVEGTFEVYKEGNEPKKKHIADKEERDSNEQLNVNVISPSILEGREVVFNAETGFTRDYERRNLVAQYWDLWVMEGNEYKKVAGMRGLKCSRYLKNGDYKVTHTIKKGIEVIYEKDIFFSVYEDGNGPIE